MALIALVTAGEVEVVGEPIRFESKPAAEGITAGAPITQDANGDWINSDANGAGRLATVEAIAGKTVVTGQALTGIKEGYLSGYDFTGQDYGDPIYVSDTVGRIADAAGSTSLPVGHVESGTGNVVNSSHDKLLAVNIPG